MPQYIERLLTTIETLHEQIAKADDELEQLAAEDPICQRLMSVPGIGPVTSMRFVSAIDDVTVRFSSDPNKNGANLKKRGRRTSRSASDSTNSSALMGAGEPAAAEFGVADQ